MRVLLEITFDGGAFHGWQVQKNAVSVQQTLCEAFSGFFGGVISVTGCSRTDAGVHARRFFCHADLPLTFPPDRLPAAINPCLPRSLAVVGAREVPGDFHARYSAISKTYRYYILNSSYRRPLLDGRAFFFPKPLDLRRFSASARLFEGRHDFVAFMASGSDVGDTVRTVYSCRCFADGSLIVTEITADGFLYNMVRIIVGTLIRDASGASSTPVEDIIASRDRRLAGFTAPPCGLYLWDVCYGEVVPGLSETHLMKP